MAESRISTENGRGKEYQDQKPEEIVWRLRFLALAACCLSKPDTNLDEFESAGFMYLLNDIADMIERMPDKDKE